jgi:hypothetical protein
MTTHGSDIVEIHCGSHQIHDSPGHYKYWQRYYADQCAKHDKKLHEVYLDRMLNWELVDKEKYERDYAELQTEIAGLSLQSDNRSSAIAEYQAILETTSSAFERILLIRKIEELEKLPRTIQSKKMQLGKMKRKITQIDQEIIKINNDENFRACTENYINDQVLRFGYFPDLWTGKEHLLPSGVAIFEA